MLRVTWRPLVFRLQGKLFPIPCLSRRGGGGGKRLQTWVGRNKGSHVLPGRPNARWYFLWTDQPATHPPARPHPLPKYTTSTRSTCGGHPGGRPASLPSKSWQCGARKAVSQQITVGNRRLCPGIGAEGFTNARSRPTSGVSPGAPRPEEETPKSQGLLADTPLSWRLTPGRGLPSQLRVPACVGNPGSSLPSPTPLLQKSAGSGSR